MVLPFTRPLPRALPSYFLLWPSLSPQVSTNDRGNPLIPISRAEEGALENCIATGRALTVRGALLSALPEGGRTIALAAGRSPRSLGGRARRLAQNEQQ